MKRAMAGTAFPTIAAIVIGALLACNPSRESASPEAPNPDLLPIVVESMSEQLGIQLTDIDPDAPFSQLVPPPDELDVVELIMRVEERTGIEVTDEAMRQELGSADIGTIASFLTARGLARVLSH